MTDETQTFVPEDAGKGHTAKVVTGVGTARAPAPKKPPVKKPAPKRVAVGDIPITPALIRRVIESITIVFLDAAKQPFTVGKGKAHTVTIGPFPESLQGYPEEWDFFEQIAIAVDGIATTYAVVDRLGR